MCLAQQDVLYAIFYGFYIIWELSYLYWKSIAGVCTNVTKSLRVDIALVEVIACTVVHDFLGIDWTKTVM